MLNNDVKPCSVHVLLAVESIKKHIDADPFQFKKASDLLSYLNVANRNSVAKTFKDQHDAGIAHYMAMQRLEASKKLLVQGISIKIIAGKCCYKKQSSFCKAFKRAFNTPPSEWQRLYR